jgi:hypothetical protein
MRFVHFISCKYLHKVRNRTLLGSDRGVQSAAVLDAATGTGEYHDIDPFAYLVDILRRRPSHLDNQLDQPPPQLRFASPSARRATVA